MTDRELISMAAAAMENSYSPYSRFPVGAALECTDGKVFTGCNIENAALGNTICAERVALFTAVAAGQRSFRRIAIASNGASYCYPCGACRQSLVEFSPGMEVLCSRADGRYVSYPLKSLLASAFTNNSLE